MQPPPFYVPPKKRSILPIVLGGCCGLPLLIVWFLFSLGHSVSVGTSKSQPLPGPETQAAYQQMKPSVRQNFREISTRYGQGEVTPNAKFEGFTLTMHTYPYTDGEILVAVEDSTGTVFAVDAYGKKN